MSDRNYFRKNSSRSASSPMNQYRKTSAANLLPRTPVLYNTQANIRNELPESESLSELTEVPMSCTMMLPAPFRQMNVPTTPSPLTSQPQRAVHQQIRPTPFSYNHSANIQLSPAPQFMLPSSSSYTLPSIYKPYDSDQSFVMHSVEHSEARGRPVLEEKRMATTTTDISPTSKTFRSIRKSLTQGPKLKSVNRRRFLVGTIDQVVRWHKIAKQLNLHAIYEVTAILETISRSPSGDYRIILRNEQRNCTLPLQAIFFPIDRDLPKVKAGDLITCIGRMVGANKLQVYDMWSTTPESLPGLKRISFLCQRTLQEVNLAAPEP